MRHVHIHISGIVQGVGFRPFVYREACAHGINGWVNNAGDGVHVEAHGEDAQVAAFVDALSSQVPVAACVETVNVQELTPGAWDTGAEQGFRILASDAASERTTLVSPDIATCPDCVRELFDAGDRRYHYPFINCTNCGPRFTIIRSLPYDRVATSMAEFAMCPSCAAEYADPADRRFHAQPDACFECGPHLTWRERKDGIAGTMEGAAKTCESSSGGIGAQDTAGQESEEQLVIGSAPAKSDTATWWHTDLLEQSKTVVAEEKAVVGSDLAISDAIIERCTDLLEQGGIVAIKGLGGFHLACDASNEGAVAELRRRKRRSNKPLAIMVRNIEAARSVCKIDETEEALLTGSVRPIVLLQRSHAFTDDETPAPTPNAPSGHEPEIASAGFGAATLAPHTCKPPGNIRTKAEANTVAIAPNVAFDLPELGVMLPYTPLQHLLLAACEERGVQALVMTSGNISEEPIEIDDALAWEKLVGGGVADALLGNDRAILSRFDDSVVRVVDGAVMPVRRARGYAPRPLTLPVLSASPANAPAILACGPEQKATLAFTRENSDGSALCFVSQHIGDVENGSTFDAWNTTRKRFSELFDLQASALACDLHPSYLPSQWAREQARAAGLPLVEVQHHHAHIASVIAETATEGCIDPCEKVIGLAFDGTGAGGDYNERGELIADGSIWGGEILIASLDSFTRAAHLPQWRLPGGAASVRDARRNAFSLLTSLGLLDHPCAAALLSSLSDQERNITATMIERGINSPLTSSMGRLFDAVAAILGISHTASYEGEPAIRLEAAAWRAIGTNYGSVEAFFAQVEQKIGKTDRYAKGSATISTETRLASAIPSLIKQLLDQIGSENPGCPTFLEPNALPNESVFRISGETAYLTANECKKLSEVRTDASQKQPLAADDIKRCMLALQFHLDIAQSVVDATQQIRKQTGIGTVALSGGVFMNRLFLQLVKKGLEQQGFKVLIPHTVPVNDGCIAYGQAAIARTRLSVK